MNETDNLLLKWALRDSRSIKPGQPYTLYLLYCTACKTYRKIASGVPMGPGGTLSCRICSSKKQNPTLEGCYGQVRVKKFVMILPEEVRVCEEDKDSLSNLPADCQEMLDWIALKPKREFCEVFFTLKNEEGATYGCSRKDGHEGKHWNASGKWSE